MTVACSSEDKQPPAIGAVDTGTGDAYFPPLPKVGGDSGDATADGTVDGAVDSTPDTTADTALPDTAIVDGADAEAAVDAPAFCSNMTKDGNETDIDCGGSTCAARCALGKECSVDGDCADKRCNVTTKRCTTACTDTVQNGTETDVDCGGASCPKCGDLKKCSFKEDCASGVCTDGRCQTPSCTDGVKNGLETDVDCGGGCSKKCNLGQQCSVAADCSTKSCALSSGVFRCECPAGMARVNVAGSSGIFCIDRAEVTNQQYSDNFLATGAADPLMQPAYCSWNATFAPAPANWPASMATVSDPVRGVDWCDARAYCEAQGKVLCNRVGGGAVPADKYADNTVSKWYQACSQGSNTYPYGATYSPTICNGADRWTADSGVPTAWGVYNQPTGLFLNTACYGGVSSNVYQLSGNVAEWEDSCATAAGPTDTCLVRGGSYTSTSAGLRCDAKQEVRRDTQSPEIGFRCCL